MQVLRSVDSHGQETAGILPILQMKPLSPKEVTRHSMSVCSRLPSAGLLFPVVWPTAEAGVLETMGFFSIFVFNFVFASF